MTSNPIAVLSKCLAQAEFVDMPYVEDERRVPDYQVYRGSSAEQYAAWRKANHEPYERKPHDYELFVHAMFPQTWSNTALGFGGMAGQAFTTAYVVIIGCTYNGTYCVYFGGQFAYALSMDKLNNETFWADIQNARMADVGQQSRYHTKVKTKNDL